MKQLLSLSLLTLMVLLAASCQQDPSSSGNQRPALHTSTSGTPANPAIVYTYSVTTGTGTKKTTYAHLGVMDTTGANQTSVYSASTTSEGEWSPTWAPGGGSISWIKLPNGSPDNTGATYIMAEDISVNSNGIPVASNLRTIATCTNYKGGIWAQAWSSLSSTGQIAFVMTDSEGSNGAWDYLCTVSTSGGSWHTLAKIWDNYSTTGLGGGSFGVAWSPDDSKIVVTYGSTSKMSLMIYDASSGAQLDSIAPPSGDNGALHPEWSHSGLNSISYGVNTGTAWALYYDTPGSAPTTNGVTFSSGAQLPTTWSPDNSSLMLVSGGALKKLWSFSSNTTTVLSTFGGSSLNWKH